MDIWNDQEGIWAEEGPYVLGPFASAQEAEDAVRHIRSGQLPKPEWLTDKEKS